ncbi:DUF5518 domain-containing protein [Haladaptatus sp. NG-WS-4]
MHYLTVHGRRRHNHQCNRRSGGNSGTVIHGVFPILGGAVAGYLQRGTRSDGIRIGALSGAIAAIPFLLLFGAIGSFMFTGSMMDSSLGVPRVTALLFVFGLVIAFVWNVRLSALGGYLGVYVATETDIGT